MLILIVDDDGDQAGILQGFLEQKGYTALTASNGPDALQLLKQQPVDLVLLDNRMPGMSGVEVLEKMNGINPMVRSIMITAYGDMDTVIKTMKLGACEFLEKPVDLSQLADLMQRMDETLRRDQDAREVQEELDSKELPLRFIAESDAMKEVISLVLRMASSQWPVLIHGETGTGKELIAQLIHLLSERKDEFFMDVNCAAIPENLFESELFGHVKGAFTGAIKNRKGCFEMAHGGTLFLDEIGEMPLAVQPKLLRALQEGRVRKLGNETDLPVDVRLVSATNRDLKSMAEDGLFREDLLYRIRVLEINLPPLRERKTDIPLLLEYFLNRYSPKRPSSGPVSFTPEAVNTLVKYPFPGNVRELEHIVQRSVTLARGSLIHTADLPAEILYCTDSSQGTLEERLKTVEHRMIHSALERSGWVQTKAADSLGISERVLRYKMSKAGIVNIRKRSNGFH